MTVNESQLIYESKYDSNGLSSRFCRLLTTDHMDVDGLPHGEGAPTDEVSGEFKDIGCIRHKNFDS
jgi:hypothetical protein